MGSIPQPGLRFDKSGRPQFIGKKCVKYGIDVDSFKIIPVLAELMGQTIILPASKSCKITQS